MFTSKSNKNQKLIHLVKAAMIAAIYSLLSLLLARFSFGGDQIRLAEALTILPVFDVSAIAGLTIGCVLTNIQGTLAGLDMAIDIFVGSFTTFISAYLTYKWRKRRMFGLPLLSVLPPVILNALVVGIEITLQELGWHWNWAVAAKNIFRVGVGQFVACVLIGLPLCKLLGSTVFKKEIVS
ncbi:MAG: QueT transporter family protein [Oscillospiraceae bacterium]|jgi:uncharacterized membrane protein|nr:QueT transporter family protein [Oscillospiraceae bacterium]